MGKTGVFLALFFLILTVPLVGQTSYHVETCMAGQKLIGGRHKVTVPDKAYVRQGKDIDYQEFFVSFGSGKNRVWMHGIWGPMASSGQVPRDWVNGSVGITGRTWKSDLIENGVDETGKSSDGTNWRYFGVVGQEITYYGVNKEAVEYFDHILNTVCFDPTMK